MDNRKTKNAFITGAMSCFGKTWPWPIRFNNYRRKNKKD